MSMLTETIPVPVKRPSTPRAKPKATSTRPAASGPASPHPTAPVVLPAADSEVLAEPREWLWTPEFYDRASDLGFFDGMRVELIKGRVYVMPAMGPKHVLCIRLASHVFHEHFADGFTVDCQVPELYEMSKPEPDVSVLRGRVRELDDDPKRVLLVLEVSNTTLRFDQTVKAAAYAEAGYPDYWLVNIPKNLLEIRRESRRSAEGKWEYVSLTRHGPDEAVSPLAKPDVKIKVADLLP